MLNAVNMVVWHVTSPVSYAILSGGPPPPPPLRKIVCPEDLPHRNNWVLGVTCKGLNL